MSFRTTRAFQRMLPCTALIVAAWLVPAAGAEAHEIGNYAGERAVGYGADVHGTAPERVRALIDRYHASGDDHLLDQGWRLVEPALRSGNTDPATLLAAAWLAQAGHDFERAQAYLRHLVLLRPDHGEAWLLRASVALVQGDVGMAREACSRSTLAVPVVITVACFARVDAHRSDMNGTRQAYRRLAATLAARSPANPDLLGWLHGAAADLAARGGLEEEAGEHYRVALQLTPTVSVRTGFADLLLAIGRPEAVLTLITPKDTAPSLVLRRMLAQQQVGDGPAAEYLAEVDARFTSWIEHGDMQHAREMALFYLRVQPNPTLAYDLAQRNFRNQREPEDRALLCEAAGRVGASVVTECPTGAVGLPVLRAISSAAW